MTPSTADQICERMSRIRARAHGKAEVLGQETREFLSWKHYIKLFPIPAILAAAAVGYWLVPKRKSTRLDSATIEKIAESQQRAADEATRAPQPTLLSTAVGSVMNFALKAGMTYLGKQLLQRMLEPAASQPASQEDEHGSGPDSPRYDWNARSGGRTR